jgi:hypothetical protein
LFVIGLGNRVKLCNLKCLHVSSPCLHPSPLLATSGSAPTTPPHGRGSTPRSEKETSDRYQATGGDKRQVVPGDRSTPPLIRSSAPPLLRSSAPPRLRSSAPPLLRSSAPPLLRSSAPPLLPVQFSSFWFLCCHGLSGLPDELSQHTCIEKYLVRRCFGSSCLPDFDGLSPSFFAVCSATAWSVSDVGASTVHAASSSRSSQNAGF